VAGALRASHASQGTWSTSLLVNRVHTLPERTLIRSTTYKNFFNLRLILETVSMKMLRI
jgi:hypothetical protein